MKGNNSETEELILYNSIYMSYLEYPNHRDRKKNSSCQELGEGIESYCLMGSEFQVFKMKRVLEMDNGDGYTAIYMYFMSLNCTLKNIKDGKFHVFYHNKKNWKETKSPITNEMQDL